MNVSLPNTEMFGLFSFSYGRVANSNSRKFKKLIGINRIFKTNKTIDRGNKYNYIIVINF